LIFDVFGSGLIPREDLAMKQQLAPQEALHIWRQALTRSFRDERPDLSARQMAIMLDV
jgi:hypothetical protein